LTTRRRVKVRMGYRWLDGAWRLGLFRIVRFPISIGKQQHTIRSTSGAKETGKVDERETKQARKKEKRETMERRKRRMG
jgi:hypothetical protein